ncbi:MAG: aminotransferase class I/II-fold pyridoxal phosphate-dependent enzyme, partial [Nodosilinea sp.]
LGGYAAGSKSLIAFLRNRAPGWIYTTGLSPADTAAALIAVQLVQHEPQRRSALWNNVRLVVQQLDLLLAKTKATAPTLRRLCSESPIICLEGLSSEAVMAASKRLHQGGLWVAAVRPPTVPTSRLRITLMATHNLAHLDELLLGLQEIL